MGLTFDEPSHTYRVDGRVVPSVTQLLDKLHDFAGVPEEVLEAAKQRGTYVHRMCEMFDKDELDIPLVPVHYRGYLSAWEAFSVEYGPQWQGIEFQDFSRLFGYAGTMDRCGTLPLKYPPTTRWVVDIKTSADAHPVWGMQTAAYRQIKAEADASYALARRATVQLRADGRFKFLPWDEPTDWPAFQSLITLSNWSNKCLK
ncbi:MAG TPA: hypothetical protein VGF12_07180 [Roseateles sp.]|uniref:hypothetical protein n=1 Tax=Roseateles sp. TaxID=1971397 RepID=UPI002ED85552